MKSNGFKIFLIVILSILVLVVTAFMINMINGNIKFSNLMFSHSVSNKLVLDKTYDNDFTEVNINSSAADVYIKESVDNKVRVIIYGNKENLSVDSADKRLTIKMSSEKRIGFCFSISKVEIYLPNDYDNLIKVVDNYGDIEIGRFPEATFDIEEDCGDVSILSGNIVTIDSDYGDVDLKDAVQAEINVSSGDVNIKKVNNVVVNNQYGDIKIENVNNYLNLVNDCGDITIDNIDLNKKSFIKDDYGDVKIGSTNKIYIDAKTELGDVEIKNNYQKSDIILKIENNCGDITIEN